MKTKFIAALVLTSCCCGLLRAGSLSDSKLEKLARIVRYEFVRVKSPMRPEKWQVYPTTSDPKIKAAIYAKAQKQVTPFETRAKMIGIPGKVAQQINRTVADRFPYKTPDEIAKGAIIESERELPLIKVGDDVTIRYFRNNRQSRLSGKVQSIRNDGETFEVNNQLVHLSEIRSEERKYFNPAMNREAREKFIENYKLNFDKIKRNFGTKLREDALEKVSENEKNGYIFFRGGWRTAKFVTDQLFVYYKKHTDQKLAIEKKSFIPNRPPAPVKDDQKKDEPAFVRRKK